MALHGHRLEESYDFINAEEFRQEFGEDCNEICGDKVLHLFDEHGHPVSGVPIKDPSCRRKLISFYEKLHLHRDCPDQWGGVCDYNSWVAT